MTAFLVTGTDPSLVSRALDELLLELVPPDGPSELEEYEPGEEGGEGGDKGHFDLSRVLTALSTPSWLSDRRVIVLRDAGALSSAQARSICELLAAPPTENVLVLAAAGRAVPAELVKAVKASGGRLVDADPGRTARSRADWLEGRLQRVAIHLDAAARRRLAEHVGEDAARVDPILELLEAAYGTGSRVTVDELEPLLGEEGGAPPWELTDAIDSGDGEKAVQMLHRMLASRHPLGLLALLHRHVAAMLRLDGATDVHGEEDAATVLKMSAFPARKALAQSRRLGHDRIARAVEVLATADADLRGRVAWPAELVIEVAVARLAQLSRQTARPRPASSRR